MLHLLDDSDKYRLNVHPCELPLGSQVFCINMKRFTNDAYGSSSSESGVVRVAITL